MTAVTNEAFESRDSRERALTFSSSKQTCVSVTSAARQRDTGGQPPRFEAVKFVSDTRAERWRSTGGCPLIAMGGRWRTAESLLSGMLVKGFPGIGLSKQMLSDDNFLCLCRIIVITTQVSNHLFIWFAFRSHPGPKFYYQTYHSIQSIQHDSFFKMENLRKIHIPD